MMSIGVSAAPLVERLRLRHDASTSREPDGSMVLAEGLTRVALGPFHDGMAAAVRALCDGGDTESGLCSVVSTGDGESAVLGLHLLLHRLMSGGWLERALSVDGRDILTFQPRGHRIPPPAIERDPQATVRLYEHAFLRRSGDAVTLESPTSGTAVLIHDPRLVALVACLARPRRVGDLDSSMHGLAEASLARVVTLLTDTGLLTRSTADADESADPSIAQWAFPDLLLHTRSRLGRHVGGYGGTYPGRELFPPLPVAKPASRPVIDLHRPDLAALALTDPPLTEVLERRRSCREHDDACPISSDQLGEFLYRVARVRRTFVGADGQELSDRPYPAGGAVYELEIYPLVVRCTGLSAGLYHYLPLTHELELVTEPGSATDALVEQARIMALMDSSPQVLLLLSARFGRVMWKYAGIAYSLILKHVGVLCQTMYCVATAMDLALCALGGGDADTFAEAAGTGYYDESSVGELVLGSRHGAEGSAGEHMSHGGPDHRGTSSPRESR
jgi:SagB-type dehydrogenase family enzyme